MAEYRGVAGVAREVKKKYLGVAGVAREITKEYRGVAGVARLYFQNNYEYEITFANANLAAGTNDYFCGFDEDGVLKFYLDTTLSSTLQDNRPTVTAKITNGQNLSGRTLEFVHKRTIWEREKDDFVLYFLNAQNQVIGGDFTYLSETSYTTTTVTIPDETIYVCFSMNCGKKGDYEETAWINHLAIDGEDII